MSLSLSCLNQVCVPYCESALLATTYTCPLKCLGPLFGLPTQKKLALKLYKTYTGTRISEQKNNVLSCTTVRDILTDLWIIILIFGTYLLVCENNTISVQGWSSSEHQPMLKRWTLDNVITLTSDDSRNIGDDSRQWRQSLWDRGDVSPPIFTLGGDMPINVPPNIWEFLFLKQ